ncbi:MAG: prephenate dehydratase [Xenococcaceae cyanobacterium MO_188.B32]|nr:prephenate dehydratase [Xenococcaceae cyanobacterium MO_188.B32]
MKVSIAHLGPTGTNSETAAIAYANWLGRHRQQEAVLFPCPSIAITLDSVAQQKVDLAVVPVENSIEGSVTTTLDRLWQLEQLKIIQALILPISHALLSCNASLKEIQTVYSHPQALAQCQNWLAKFLPSAKLVAINSTTSALPYLKDDLAAAAISSPRAAQLYQIPILCHDIGDYSDNCTRFWIVSSTQNNNGSHLSLAFSLPKNVPGALVKPLQIFARRGINMSKIESRPTKRLLGEYIFFIDLEGNLQHSSVTAALTELSQYTETLKIFGNYDFCQLTNN